jgi:hypothetical protein
MPSAKRYALALAIAGAAVLATAVPALAGTPAGPGISISPVGVAGPQLSYHLFTVRDAGTVSETIRVQVIELRPAKGVKGAMVRYGDYGHALVTPAVFTLTPGQARSVKVTVTSKDGLTHSLAIEASAAPPAGGTSVTTYVGARYLITGKPNPYATPVTVKVAPDKPSGFPWAPVGASAVLALALAAMALVVVRRRHRSTATV